MITSDPSQIAATNRVLHLEDARARRRERGELATEGMTAFTLLDAVREAHAHHEIDAFLLLNAVAGIALAIAVVRGAIDIRRHRDTASSGINVVGVFGGIAAIVEGIRKLHTAEFTPGHKHFALGVFAILVGLLTAVVALMTERLEQRRALSITDDGIGMRLNRFRRFKVSWPEITGMRVHANEVQLSRTDGGTCVVPLTRIVNRDEVSDALVAAAIARGVKVEGAETT